MKPTVIIGASENPHRYSYKAANLLKKHGHQIFPYGIREGKVADEFIDTAREHNTLRNIDTITLYINPAHQVDWYDFIVHSKPKRVIFNPGTENPELESILDQSGIPYEEACTLVLLNTDQY